MRSSVGAARGGSGRGDRLVAIDEGRVAFVLVAAAAATAAATAAGALGAVVIGRGGAAIGDRSGGFDLDLAGLDDLVALDDLGRRSDDLFAGLAREDGVDQVILAQTAEAVDAELVGEQVQVRERALLQGGAFQD